MFIARSCFSVLVNGLCLVLSCLNTKSMNTNCLVHQTRTRPLIISRVAVFSCCRQVKGVSAHMNEGDILREVWRGDRAPPSRRAECSEAEKEGHKRQKFATQNPELMGFVTAREATDDMIAGAHFDFAGTETGGDDGGGAGTDAVTEAGGAAWGGSLAGDSSATCTEAGGSLEGGGSLRGEGAAPLKSPVRTAATTVNSIVSRTQSRNPELAPSPLGGRHPAIPPPTPNPPIVTASARPVDSAQSNLLSFFPGGKPPAHSVGSVAARVASSRVASSPAQAQEPSGLLRNGQWASYKLNGPFGKKQLCQIIDMPGAATKAGMSDVVVAHLVEGDDLGSAGAMVRTLHAVHPHRLTACEAPVWAAAARSFARPGRALALDHEWHAALNNVAFKQWLDKTRHPAPQDPRRGEKRLKAALLGVLEGKGASTRDGLVASSSKSRDADHKENKSKIVTERLAATPGATADERKKIVDAVTEEVEQGSYRATSRVSSTNRNTLAVQSEPLARTQPTHATRPDLCVCTRTCGSARVPELAHQSRQHAPGRGQAIRSDMRLGARRRP